MLKPLQMEKKKRIEECAMRLFLEKGIDETSINDIVKEVHLAKGTFYTYFKDKSALINEIIVKKNIHIVHELIEKSREESISQEENWATLFLRTMIAFYKENPYTLRLMQRSFRFAESRELVLKELQQSNYHFDAFIKEFYCQGDADRDTWNRFLLLMEITGIVCFHAIFYQQPDDIEHIEPLLRQILCIDAWKKGDTK